MAKLRLTAAIWLGTTTSYLLTYKIKSVKGKIKFSGLFIKAIGVMDCN